MVSKVKKVRNYQWVAAIIGLAVVAILGLYLKSSTQLQPVKLRLGWLHQAQFAGFYVAQEKGFYRQAGLDVEILELDTESNQVTELVAGETDFSVMEAHQALVSYAEGNDIKAVSVIYQGNPHALAVREDSDIFGPEDFIGKVLGLSGGDAEGNAIFSYFLSNLGISDQVEMVNLGFNTVQDFIDKNADIIDLYKIDQPYLAQKRGVPLRVISLDAFGFSTYGDVLIGQTDFIESDPELVNAFVDATLKGWEYALGNNESTVDIVMNYASGDYADRDYQDHILKQSATLIRGAGGRLGRMELLPWSALYEALKSGGLIQKEFDVRDIYTNQFIDE